MEETTKVKVYLLVELQTYWHLRAACQRARVNLADFSILGALADNGSISIRDLSRKTKIQESMLYKYMDRFVRNRLATRSKEFRVYGIGHKGRVKLRKVEIAAAQLNMEAPRARHTP